jgi:hypothetical protein
MKTNFIGQINGEQFNSKEAFINKLNELGIKDVNFDNIINKSNHPFYFHNPQLKIQIISKFNPPGGIKQKNP